MPPPNWHVGPYARLITGLLPPDHPSPAVPLPALLRPEVLDPLLLKLYGAELMPAQRPVLVSQWSKYYFMQIFPALLVTQLAAGWFLPLQLDEWGVVLDERGLPVAVKPVDPGEPGSPSDSLEPWIATHLRPLIEALSGAAGPPPAILWGNAGDYLERAVRQLQSLGLRSLAPAESLLGTRRLADGRANPLYAPVQYAGDGRRQRRSCCLSYQVPWVGACEGCPMAGAPG